MIMISNAIISPRHTCHAMEDILPACETALASLQLEYLDLYLVHGPVSFRKGALGTEDRDNLGYDPDRMANTWKVCRSDIYLFDHPLGMTTLIP